MSISNNPDRRSFLASGMAVLAAAGAARAGDTSVSSPDGHLTIRFISDGGPAWSIERDRRQILLPSRLGIEIDGAGSIEPKFAAVAHRHRDETWNPVYGERSTVRDLYNEITIPVSDPRGRAPAIEIIIRAYNEGAAVRYRVPGPSGGRFTICRELTSFRFAADHSCYPVYSAQGVYNEQPLSRLRPGCERPLTIRLDKKTWVAVAEAGLVDYARMRLRPALGQPFTVEADLAGRVKATAPFASPWRVLMVADRPGDLLQNNDLILNLNEPCALSDTAWIKPGKVIRDITVTTAGAKACVDFAVARNLRYVEIDAGWYGPEISWLSDARRVSVDPARSKGPLDLTAVLAHAREKGIGVWLYVNRRQLELRHEELFELYEKWGVAGVKFGFVQVGSQRWTEFVHRAVRAAAEHHLMVDIHDEYRPTGVSRTWPNLLTQEGVRGNEEMPPAENNLYLPFTRFLCGAADATVCWQDPRLKNSPAHQMAASVAFYSPLQFLYWYDQPAKVIAQPALDFFDRVPTVWDETRVLAGEPGKFVSIARRRGEDWFVGTMNAVERRDLEVRLDFLESGRKYQAFVYEDRIEKSPTEFVTATAREVDATTVLTATCQNNGGQAVRIAAETK